MQHYFLLKKLSLVTLDKQIFTEQIHHISAESSLRSPSFRHTELIDNVHVSLTLKQRSKQFQ